jgi:alpha-L-fucosidase 2
MICVYPGRQIHPTTTPEVAKAAQVGLVARRDHGPEHRAGAGVEDLHVRPAGRSDLGLRELVNVATKKIYGNLWATHPPFQIDANFGYAAAINEMLIQSHMGDMQLLPACRRPGRPDRCAACGRVAVTRWTSPGGMAS